MCASAPTSFRSSTSRAVKTVYSVKETFLKTKWYKRLAQDTDNMFNTADVTYHRKSRRMLAASMADSAILKLAPRVGGHVSRVMEKMKAENSRRKTIDIYKWWLFMTTDIIVEFTYGESFHMVDKGVVSFGLFRPVNVGANGLCRKMNIASTWRMPACLASTAPSHRSSSIPSRSYPSNSSET